MESLSIVVALASLAGGHGASMLSNAITVKQVKFEADHSASNSELFAEMSVPSWGHESQLSPSSKLLAQLFLAFNPAPFPAFSSKILLPTVNQALSSPLVATAHAHKHTHTHTKSRFCQNPLMSTREALRRLFKRFADGEKADKEGGADKNKGAAPISVADGRLVHKLFADGEKADPVLYFRPEIDKLTEVLSCRSQRNALVIGDPGSGRDDVLRGFAQMVAAGEVPQTLEGTLLVQLKALNLPDTREGFSVFKQQLSTALGHPCILVLDGINKIAAETADPLLAARKDATDPMGTLMRDMLLPLISRRSAQVIVKTTMEDYVAREEDAFLKQYFSPVVVQALTPERAVDVVKSVAYKYEEHHQVSYTSEAIEACVKLSDKYIAEGALPRKAISILDRAGASVQLRESRANKGNRNSRQVEVMRSDVAAVVAELAGIPCEEVSSIETARLMKLEDTLKRRVVGQDQGVNAVARAMRRARAGLKDPKRPIASLLFCGPTGVGKTELCKALAEAYFGKEDKMIRLDMSEYNDRNTVAKLIGSPPGYVGSYFKPKLTEAVQRNPHSLLLFDEIEKAHTDVHDLMLQILEDGRLTDARGRVLSFKNMLIIMTSNIGSEAISGKVQGFGFQDLQDSEYAHKVQHDKLKSLLMDKLKSSFRPEFVNRVDEVIVFQQLERSQTMEIAELELEKVYQRMKEKGISITLTEKLKDMLVDQGFNPSAGARDLRRAITQTLGDALADFWLKHSADEVDKVIVDLDADGNVVILAQEATAQDRLEEVEPEEEGEPEEGVEPEARSRGWFGGFFASLG